MKNKLLFLGLSILTLNSSAQEHHADNYNVSAYKNFKDIPAPKRIDKQSVRTKVNQQFPGWYVYTDKLNASFTDIFGKSLAIPGNSIDDKIAYCFSNQLAALGINKQEWYQVQNTNAGFGTFVTYKQKLSGHDVAFSRLSFRFSKDGKLERIQMKNYGIPANVSASLTQDDAKKAAREGLSGVIISDNTISQDLVWFPAPSKNGYELIPSWEFAINGKDEHLPVELTGYVSAVTGQILYRNNNVNETADLTVNGVVYKQNPLLPSSIEPLADLLIDVNGSQYFTDAAGYFSDANLSTPVSATVSLQGKWSKVNDQAQSGITPDYTVIINNTGTSTTFDTVAPSNDRVVNAYYHVTRVHDFMKGYFPAFTGMDFPLSTNVDNTGGTCNAFYTGANGSSINFFRKSPGCNSMAYCGDIIYHEYGHGINHKFYQSQGANGMNNGALNEGSADIWGLGITGDPVLGKGAFSNGGVIRRYDQAPKVYPFDILGEVHADGEIIAGAWWDVSVNIASVDTMTQLFTKTYFDIPDGPNGTEGDIYHSILISALIADDNDANIVNGTPHFSQIVSAFARHGIYLLGNAYLNHTEIANQPGNTPITINASLAVDEPAFLQDFKIVYKDRSAQGWDTLSMTNIGGLNYNVTLPAFPAGTIVDYYFSIHDVYSYVDKYFPENYFPGMSATIINIPFQFGVGLDKKTGDDFEAGTGSWVIGDPSDDATTGDWIHASPVPSSARSVFDTLIVQTGADHTTNSAAGKCLVTGNANSVNSNPSNADVDRGITTITSPVYDLTGFSDPVIEYFRWYGNDRGRNRGSDNWQVDMKEPTSFLWSRVELTNKSDYSWRRRIFKVSSILTSMSGNQVVVRFIASDRIVPTADDDGESTVEAAVDDVFIYDKTVTGVNEVAPAKALIYPNPANNEIRVSLSKNTKGTISLNDVTGKEIMKLDVNINSTEYTMPTKSLANGTYMITIHSEKSIQTSKVVVMH